MVAKIYAFKVLYMSKKKNMPYTLFFILKTILIFYVFREWYVFTVFWREIYTSFLHSTGRNDFAQNYKNKFWRSNSVGSHNVICHFQNIPLGFR